MDYFEASRVGKGSGILRVAIMRPAASGEDGYITIGGEDDTIEESILPRPEAVEWLIARHCSRDEAIRICDFAERRLFGQSSGAEQTAIERILETPTESRWSE